MRSAGLTCLDWKRRPQGGGYTLFDRGQLLQVNALDPLLQFAGILVLQFYLDEITVGDHHPQSSVLGVFFECFETGLAIDVHRFGVAFAGVAVTLPRFGRSADIIRVRN